MNGRSQMQKSSKNSDGIFKQSMGAKNPVGILNRVVEPALQATQPGGTGSLESILELLKSLKIRALDFAEAVRHEREISNAGR
jgi:hypothetical protein